MNRVTILFVYRNPEANSYYTYMYSSVSIQWYWPVLNLGTFSQFFASQKIVIAKYLRDHLVHIFSLLMWKLRPREGKWLSIVIAGKVDTMTRVSLKYELILKHRNFIHRILSTYLSLSRDSFNIKGNYCNKIMCNKLSGHFRNNIHSKGYETYYSEVKEMGMNYSGNLNKSVNSFASILTLWRLMMDHAIPVLLSPVSHRFPHPQLTSPDATL